MNKKRLISILCALFCVVSLVGCGAKSGEQKQTEEGKQVITIGTSVISKDVLEVAQKVFNETNEEYQMEVKLFDDAITPNMAVNDGSIDGNFYQYVDYMENFNKDRGTSLKAYGEPVFAFQIGLYSEKINDLSEIKDGMSVAIANDNTNRALALKLMKKAGLIGIKDGAEVPNVLDITENPHNIKFIEMERLNLANALEDTDMSIAMADVIRNAGKDSENALAFDQEEGIVLVIKEDAAWAEAVEKALMSDEVKTYINEETKGTKTPLF